jgi:hypothetical protein
MKRKIPIHQLILFWIFILIYSIFSSSTPDNPGIFEALMGLALVAFVGAKNATHVLGGFLTTRNDKMKFLSKGMYLGFLYIAIFPTFFGIVIDSNQLSDVIRDLIPLIYFYLPLLFYPTMVKRIDRWRPMLAIAIGCIGFCYSIRHFQSARIPFYRIGRSVISGDRNYFGMDPAVIFASVYFLISLFERVEKPIKAVPFAVAAVVTVAVPASIVVRAQIFLVGFFTVLYILVNLKNFSRKTAFKILITIGAVAFIGFRIASSQIASNVVNLAMEKNSRVGLSGRDHEVAAVVDALAQDPFHFTFGYGWGSLIRTNANNLKPARFVHNVVVYFIFKTGVLGFLLMLSYFVLWGRLLFRLMRYSFRRQSDIAVVFGAGAAIALNFLLEPGYKMFSLGLILLLVLLEAKHLDDEKLTNSEPSSSTQHNTCNEYKTGRKILGNGWILQGKRIR